MHRIWGQGLLLALLGIAGDAAWCANLVSVRIASMAPPPADAELVAQSSNGLLAFRGNTLWRFDEAADRWQEGTWRDPGRPRELVVGDARSYLLTAPGADAGITRAELFGDERTARPPLPDLPAPLRSARATLLGDVLYVLGASADGSLRGWSIDTGHSQAAWTGVDLPAGVSRGVSSLNAQDGALYMTVHGGEERDELWRWTAADGWNRRVILAGEVAEGAARPIGQAHLLYLIRVPAAERSAARRSELVTYHTITDGIARQGEPFAALAQWGTGWRDGIAWRAEAAAGTAAPLIGSQIQGSAQLMRPLDWSMIALYLLGIGAIGAYCYWREAKNSTAEFFVGNRSIPFWAAAISLYVTSTSSIGYIATTAKAFATNWQYLVGNLLGVFGLMFVAVWIVPMLRGMRLVSVFDYLEQRFHPAVRMMASAMCIMLHLGGRMSIILFLPALAIATTTGFNVEWSILIMGVVTIAYTAFGGMRAVIWTDILQFIVKVGGLVFVAVFIVFSVKGGLSGLAANPGLAAKTHMFDWSFDLTTATVWGFAFVVLMETVLTFPKDQVLMQRVFTTRSDRDAGRSVWGFAAMVFPASLLFYVIGTGLWAYYQGHPERMNPLLSVDATFPLFIAAELPAGITGLMIAGIFAASMATCSSIINSVATLVSVDFYEKLSRNAKQSTTIRLAEIVSIIAGFIGVGLALILSRHKISSYLDTAVELYGLLGGGFGGAYTLGMFSRRANWQGVMIGMGASIVLTFTAWSMSLVHPQFYLGVAILCSIVFGYAGSLFFPPPPARQLEGLVVTRGSAVGAME